VKHPISVARLVMEKTPHVMLVGQGALDFALAHGFERENLLTPASEAAWKKWRAEQTTPTPTRGSAEDHDTIGMVALDAHGNLSGACTTSGLAWKLHGRVGDSPIIGAGLYVDNAVGAASATGVGEAVIRACGTFLVVELMRQGKSPREACRLAIQRITEKTKNWREIQVGLIAVNKRGEIGAYSIARGFEYSLHDTEHGNRLLPADSLLGK
jgi:N4-(beta-N-acetylglucosaminyl)-L-asparaginase